MVVGGVVADAAASEGVSAVARLHDFLLSTVVRPAAERRDVAQRTLDEIAGLAAPTLLVEIAAIGTLVRGSSTGSAIHQGYPKRSRAALDVAHRLLPAVGWTKGLDGAWHYEVMRRSRIGAILYGASLAKGDALFAEALRLDPHDGGIRLTQVVALLGRDATANAGRALAILDTVPKTDTSPYGTLVAAHAAALLALLRKGASADAARLALQIF